MSDPLVVDQLKIRYEAALRKSGLPHRSPTHRIAEHLAWAARALAYAEALELLTGQLEWKNTIAWLERDVRARIQVDQTEIDTANRRARNARRFGLP